MSETLSEKYDWKIIAEAKQIAKEINNESFQGLLENFIAEKDDIELKNTLYEAILIVLKDTKEIWGLN
ncbi:MAG TPA: hypothetical protein EYP22_03175 [Methanosarcinales archaeon]|nr:hypothetical protein [Methanosarcinales archaeon]